MRKINKTALTAIVAFTVLGLVSGMVGELWLNSFLLPDPYLNFKNYSDLSKRLDDMVSQGGAQDSSKDARDIAIENTVKQVEPSIARVYKMKKFAPNVFGSLMSQDFMAMGTIITSDGWILSGDKNISEKESYLIVTNENKVYETKEVSLAYPGVVFFKIDAANLPVIQFDSRQDIVGGQTVLLFEGAGGITTTEIKNPNNAKLDDSADFIHSSEEFYKFITLEKALDKKFLGSPVITLSGRMIGVFVEVNGTVIPTDYLVKTMKEIAQSPAKTTRPYLGIKYLDLSEVINPNVKDVQGAMILLDKKLAFALNSPAIGKLEAGDIILKLEGEEINATRNLSELIAAYKTGDTLKFLVKRGGVEKTVEVKLN